MAQEAGAADTIYRLSYGIGEKSGGELSSALTNYLTVAIADDWPAMDRGTMAAKRPARHALNELYAALLSVESAQRDNAPLVSEILRQLDVITQSRSVRLVVSEGTVPGVIWLVLFGGAVLTITFTFFFGAHSLRVQTAMTAFLSILIFSKLLIIVAINRPFSGTVKVQPQALAELLAEFKPAAGGAAGPGRQH